MSSAAQNILPEDVELEQALIGLCLKEPNAVDLVANNCAVCDFYHVPHDAIMQAIFDLHSAQSPITPLTVGARLKADSRFNEVGGREYLSNAILWAPNGNVVALARGLVDLRLRREAIQAAHDTENALCRPDVPILEALRPSLEVADHAAAVLGKREFISIRDAAAEMLARAEKVAAGDPVVACTTGVETLDKAIGGLQAGDLVVCAGRPGMGKSSFLAASALRTAMTGRPVLFFSLEMTQERLLQRIGCDLDFDEHPERPLSYSWFRNGSAAGKDVGRLAEAMQRLPDSMTIFENGDLTIQDIAALSRAYAARTGVMGLVVIDYLQKVYAGDRYRGNRVQEVTEISNHSKNLAKRLRWPVLVGAQLSRGVEARDEKRPALTDLRESGAIEQDADVVIGLYRPAYYIQARKPALGHADAGYSVWETEYESEKNRLDVLVLKNRNGETDSKSVFVDMRASAIRDEKPRGGA